MEKQGEIVRFPRNSLLWVAEAANPGYFYILRKGRIAVQGDLHFEEVRLNHYHVGDTFGLVSALTHTPHRHTLRAEEDCEVARLPIGRLGDYLQSNRTACLKIIALYANQLRTMDLHLEGKGDKVPWQDRPEKMYADAKQYLRNGDTDLACYTLARFLKWGEESRANEMLVAEAGKMLGETRPEFSLPERNENTMFLEDREIVFVENEPCDGHFYVVKSGAVQVSRLLHGRDYMLNLLGPGEIFGEMAVINNEVRSATARGHKEVSLLRLTAENFLDGVGGAVMLKLFGIVARRLWQDYQRVYLSRFEDPNIRLYFYLQILLLDEDARKRTGPQDSYHLNISLDMLKRMIGMPDLPDDRIRLFTGDHNFHFEEHKLIVRNRAIVDDKVNIYKENLKRRQGKENS